MKGGGERQTPQQLLQGEAGEEDELRSHQLQTLADCFLHSLKEEEMRRKDKGSETNILVQQAPVPGKSSPAHSCHDYREIPFSFCSAQRAPEPKPSTMMLP